MSTRVIKSIVFAVIIVLNIITAYVSHDFGVPVLFVIFGWLTGILTGLSAIYIVTK